MTKRFNPKEYLGKNRIYRAVPGAPRISRLYVWDGNQYISPPRGKCFVARKPRTELTGSETRPERYFDTLEAARNWQLGRKEEIKPDLRNGKYTVSHLIRDYKRDKWPTIRESTRIYRDKAIKLLWPLYYAEVEELRPSHVDEWLRTLKDQATKFRSVRKDFLNELETLGTILRHYIEHNDNTRLVMPIKKRHKEMAKLREGVTKTKRFMLPDELEKWFTALKADSPDFYPMAFVQVQQMLRVSEVAAMKWQNLNLANRSYRLCEHVVWPRFRGDTDGKVLPGTKTMKAGQYVDIPLTDEVCALLANLPRQSQLMFHDDGKPYTYRQIQFAYDKAFKKVGLPYRGTHVCRHTGATEFLNSTGDFLALQQMGNWSDLKTALHYGQILKTRAREALDKAKGRRLQLVTSESTEEVV